MKNQPTMDKGNRVIELSDKPQASIDLTQTTEFQVSSPGKQVYELNECKCHTIL